MALRAALVDRAFIQRRRADAVRVEGRTLSSLTESAEIRARLGTTRAAETLEDGRKLVIKRPTLLLDIKDKAKLRVVPRQSDRVRVVSKELGEAIWEIDGAPQPIRKKRRVIGWEMTIAKVEED